MDRSYYVMKLRKEIQPDTVAVYNENLRDLPRSTQEQYIAVADGPFVMDEHTLTTFEEIYQQYDLIQGTGNCEIDVVRVIF